MATMNPETTPVIAAVGEVIDRPKSPELAAQDSLRAAQR